MISVPNHRQPLNGSKILLLLGLVIFVSSCGIFQDNRQKKRPANYKKHDPAQKKDPVKKDTISWNDKVIDIPELPEEDLYRKYGSEFKNIYTVALILPMQQSSLVDDLPSLKADMSYRFINYYAGVQLALEDLSKTGLNLHVEVLNSSLKVNDERSYTNKLNKIQPDLIIGPYERDLLREIANYGRRKSIPVISPWQSSSKITKQNPYYIQLKPDIKTFYNSLVKMVDQRFAPEQVYVIGREIFPAERNRIKYLQESHEAMNEEWNEFRPYNVFYVESDSLSQGETAFDSLFVDQFYREIAVIIPNWSFRDEHYVYSCLRKLNAEKGEVKVNVIGMPLMIDSDKIGYNLYKNLNVKAVLEGYVDKDKESIKSFRKRYYDTFHALPQPEAFEGYDMMMYIGTNLNDHGTKFQYFLPEVQQEFLQTSYNLKAKFLDEKRILEDYESVDYFENGHLDVWEFRYNGFKKMN